MSDINSNIEEKMKAIIKVIKEEFPDLTPGKQADILSSFAHSVTG